jgi:hypothetical protein
MAGLLVAAATLYAIFVARTAFRIGGITHLALVDDAMVGMRYPRHLAQRYGLAWNVGEKPIKGFTNPGWLLMMAVLHLLPLAASKISLAVIIIAALILLANTLVVYRICGAISPGSRYAPLIASAITALYFPLVFWSLRGMEVGLLTLLVDLSVLAALRLTSNGRLRGRELGRNGGRRHLLKWTDQRACIFPREWISTWPMCPSRGDPFPISPL